MVCFQERKCLGTKASEDNGESELKIIFPWELVPAKRKKNHGCPDTGYGLVIVRIS